MASLNKSNPLFFASEVEAKRILRIEGKKLEEVARRVWRRYEDSHKPTEYIRTGKSARAIKLGDPKYIGLDSLGNAEYGIELTWLNNLAYHDSWIDKKYGTNKNKKGHAIMLIGTKWHSKKLEKVYKKAVYRHTYWKWNLDENSYLDAVIKEYMNTRDPRINLEVLWSGQFLK